MRKFPTNIATGDAFCNRVEKRKLLSQYIKKGMHTVIVAPRRYGKTSLVNQVLIESKLPCCILELTMATSVKDVEHMISRKVGELLQSILPKTKKAKSAILDLFKTFNPELILSAAGQKLVLHLKDEHSDSVTNISELLLKLDESATQLKKRVVVVFDEFQELSEIKDHVLEAGIRHAMQYAQSTSYVFSGSNRHMLQSMFNDKNRPFYNSCEVIKLERIEQSEYEHFIQAAALDRFDKEIAKKTLSRIFELSELHPSYVNRICGHFWLTDKYPTFNAVNQYWNDFIESRRSEFARDVLSLSKNQRRLLKHLALSPEKQPSSQAVCQAISISEASLRQALKKLSLLDYVYKDKEGLYRVLDPALKFYIESTSK